MLRNFSRNLVLGSWGRTDGKMAFGAVLQSPRTAASCGPLFTSRHLNDGIAMYHWSASSQLAGAGEAQQPAGGRGLNSTAQLEEVPSSGSDDSGRRWGRIWKGLGYVGALMTYVAQKEFEREQEEDKGLDERLDSLSKALEEQALESQAVLEEKRALQVQPLLFLTTLVTPEDKLQHQRDENEIKRQMARLRIRQIELSNVERGMRRIRMFGRVFFQEEQLEGLRELQSELERQMEALKLARIFNRVILWHKERKYLEAVDLIKHSVIGKLKTPTGFEQKASELGAALQKAIQLHEKEQHKEAKEWIEKEFIKKLNAEVGSTDVDHIFDDRRILMAAYNAQAKLYACLYGTLPLGADKQANGDHSRTSYQNALSLSLRGDWERAILLSSLAYWCTDRGWPWLAWPLREEALRLRPDDEHILCGMGLDAQQTKRTKEALHYFEKAVRLNPKVPNIYVSRGKLFVESGDKKAALSDFEAALQIDPNHSEAHFERGLLRWQDGRCREAERDFREVLFSPKSHKSLEELRRALEKREEAGGGLNFVQAAWRCKSMSHLFAEGISTTASPPVNGGADGTSQIGTKGLRL